MRYPEIASSRQGVRAVAKALVALAGLVSATAAFAQNTPASADPAIDFPRPPPPPYVTPETPQGTGTYPAIMESDPGLLTHTIYRPKDLNALGKEKLPIIAFGNGGCRNMGNRFRYFLTEIASNGFLAIAIGPLGAKQAEVDTSFRDQQPAPGSPAAAMAAAGKSLEPTPGSRVTPAFTTAAQLTDAVNWALAENNRRDSKYFGKLDANQIAVMGQSCGGLQAIDVAHDPRVKTLGVWNSGAFDHPTRAMEIAAARATKDTLKTLRVPAIYVTGEPAEVAFANADDDFTRIDGVPLFRAWMEKTGHSGTYREPNGGAYGKVAVAWLRWHLKGDTTAARMFTGTDCGLCQQPDWHVKKKNID